MNCEYFQLWKSLGDSNNRHYFLQHCLCPYSFQSVLFLVTWVLSLLLPIPFLSSIPILHSNVQDTTTAAHPSISFSPNYAFQFVLTTTSPLSFLYFFSHEAWVPAKRHWALQRDSFSALHTETLDQVIHSRKQLNPSRLKLRVAYLENLMSKFFLMMGKQRTL